MAPSSKSSAGRALCVLSNRLPFTVQRNRGRLDRKPSTGGLVKALEPALRRRGGTWIGWPGVELRRGERVGSSKDPYKVVPVSLSESEVTRYYHGFSNGTLWPLFHSLPARAHFDRRDWITYEKVNARFAEAATVAAQESELVWVHDYHLMLSPHLLREAAPDSQLAFFLHIPFPPWDLFRLLPWDRDLLRGLLACDMVGFHVDGYVQNFLDCVEKRLGARVDRAAGLVDYGGRVVKAGAFPLGIDFEMFEESAQAAPQPKSRRAERTILGVDRLDYTKGIPQRIRALERLLELHPRHRGGVVLLQLAVPSRSQVSDYRELKREIDELVGRVNGRFATDTWSPIRYLYRSVPLDRLTAMYRDADVALVTPLRDGMNLVAKEFVACQVDDPGVLVLSELAGAAYTMREALQVNPYNVDETAEAMHRALTMDETERRSRMGALRRRERRDNVHAWVEHFLDESRADTGKLTPLTDEEIGSWLTSYLQSYRVSLFLDYDGTLTPLVDHPSKARLSDQIRETIGHLAKRDDTEVAIISGRSLADVRALVDLPGITYAGNHGLEVEAPDLPAFRHEDAEHYQQRVLELAEALDEVCSGGAWVEPKGHTLTWHYRAVRGDVGALLEQTRQIIEDSGFQAREAHKALEARPPIGWDKGRAVLHVLRARYGPGWPERARVIYVGDDHTDEDAFRQLAGMAMTFRVGPAETLTAARRRLASVDAVAAVLSWLAKRPVAGA